MTEHTHTHDTAPTSTVIAASETAERMAVACANFLDTLTPELRRKAEFPFENGERQRWHYIPREMFDRKGIYLQEMDQKQREAAFSLLATGLSRTGYQKATAIIDLEATLGEQERMEGVAQLARDPELYAFSVFGDPTNHGPWGWRAEGHHVSLHLPL